MKVLVAGVGNIFLTDDGFGPEVVRRMVDHPRPAGVDIVDFGIRGIHLAYQLLEGYDLLVIVDAAPRGLSAGTVSVLEVDPVAPVTSSATASVPLMDAHSLDPVSVLGLLASLGGSVAAVRVVACEPATTVEGIGLSPEVAAAVPVAIETVGQVMVTQNSDGGRS